MGIAPVEPEGWVGAGMGIGMGVGVEPGRDCARIGIVIPWAGTACEWLDAAGADLLADLVFAADFFDGFFFGFGFFLVFAGSAFFGIGICMPGMFICSASAGAEKEASATALAASNNSIFTAGLQARRSR